MVSMSDNSSTTTLGASQESRRSPVVFPQTAQQHTDNSSNPKGRSVTPGVANGQNNDEDRDNSQQHPTQSSSQGEGEEEWLMQCRCESGKTLVTLLSCLQHVAESPSDTSATQTGTASATATATQSSIARRQRRHNTVQPVTCFCTNTGLTFHVFGPAKQSEASCEVQKSMFSDFHVISAQPGEDGEDVEDWQTGGEFCVNLTSVLDALQLLGPLLDDNHNTSVGLSYNLNSEIFKVELLHQDNYGVLCTTAIPGLMAPADDPGDALSNAFRSSPVAARMMLKSGILRELLPEWSSVAGASFATVAVGADRGLELEVVGHYGECWVQIPAVGDHLVSPLELADDKKTVTRTYPMHSLLSGLKGLDLAEETCININSQGIMAIQHKTIDPMGQGSSNFVDFIMTCLDDEDEEDPDEDEDEDDDNNEENTDATRGDARSSQITHNSTVASASYQSTRSPDSETTHRRRRRRKLQRLQQQQQDSQDTTAAGEDIVEQGSSDTEDEQHVAASPSERQKLQALQKRMQQDSHHSSSSSEDEDEEATQSIISARPLFGSVVNNKNNNNTSSASNTNGILSQGSRDSQPQRRQRRSASRPPRRSSNNKGQKRAKKKGRSKESGNDSDRSKNMFLASSEEDSDDEEEELKHHSSRISGSTHHRTNRDEDCSSPEIVYGKRE